ncbi:MAG: hypothetical protein B7Y80_13650 [Hyphomicrobium sp. 32-62-53]|nr:MAG: hypothetical protein B7Z29_12570 [Hyphomicrobium sp. 12-62-95]OYX99070.1 MAG: hypothetical protein B7Y80_13650 [Hyphomicrobium sp. 32-62-53]
MDAAEIPQNFAELAGESPPLPPVGIERTVGKFGAVNLTMPPATRRRPPVDRRIVTARSIGAGHATPEAEFLTETLARSAQEADAAQVGKWC